MCPAQVFSTELAYSNLRHTAAYPLALDNSARARFPSA